MTLPVITIKKHFVATVVAALLCILFIIVLIINKYDSPSKPDTDSQNNSTSLKGAPLYAQPNTSAARQATLWQYSRPEDAALMSKLAALPAAKWLTDASSLQDGLKRYLAGAQAAKAMPVLVVYAIPSRDCGLYSAGGTQDLKTYQSFVDKLALAIGNKRATVIVEPDAIAVLNNEDDCLSGQQLAERYQALRYATKKLSQLPASSVYLDAGNSGWGSSTEKLAERLNKAGMDIADGFSLNISNFRTTDETITYGKELSKQLEGAHFVIDTSRNGVGPYNNPRYEAYNWCNPPGRALGHYPTTNTGKPLVDAYLYIKTPGESDGQDPDFNKCHGGPKAGQWWPDYALELVKRWPANLQPPANR